MKPMTLQQQEEIREAVRQGLPLEMNSLDNPVDEGWFDWQEGYSSPRTEHSLYFDLLAYRIKGEKYVEVDDTLPDELTINGVLYRRAS